MTKGAYVGVGGVARKIKKGYVGVDGKARKIKKAYIGVGGVARPCWGGEELKYYGVVTHLSDGRASLAATTVGGYALFGGGDYNSGALPGTGKSDAVDAYTAPPLKTGTLRIKTVWGVIAYYGDETVEDEQAVSLPINANNLKVTAVYYEIPTYTDIVSTNVSWTSQPGRKTEGVAWVLDPTKDASIVWAD